MNFETPLKNIENCLDDIIGQLKTVFKVGVTVNPGNNIIVLLDSDDGITIDKCTKVNRELYKCIEEKELFPGGNFSLEVSSPGVDEPLKLQRQYLKNIGRTVQVLLLDASMHEGKLVEVDEENIAVEEKDARKDGKPNSNKAVKNKITISFNQIKHTKVLVTF
ncbi:MAG: ribosome maturation factor [Ginsengibacter sp.]